MIYASIVAVSPSHGATVLMEFFIKKKLRINHVHNTKVLYLAIFCENFISRVFAGGQVVKLYFSERKSYIIGWAHI